MKALSNNGLRQTSITGKFIKVGSALFFATDLGWVSPFKYDEQKVEALHQNHLYPHIESRNPKNCNEPFGGIKQRLAEFLTFKILR